MTRPQPVGQPEATSIPSEANPVCVTASETRLMGSATDLPVRGLRVPSCERYLQVVLVGPQQRQAPSHILEGGQLASDIASQQGEPPSMNLARRLVSFGQGAVRTTRSREGFDCCLLTPRLTILDGVRLDPL